MQLTTGRDLRLQPPQQGDPLNFFVYPYVEIDGKRYCHILDARTGMPVNYWQSVSVVAPLCVAAGSCATMAMLLGRAAPAFLEGQGVRWVGVTAEGRLTGDAPLA